MSHTALAIAQDYSWVPQAPPRTYRLYPGERLVFRSRPYLSASDWAQGNCYIAVSAMPGLYDGDVTPYAKGILEAFSTEWVRELFLAGGSQSAKSQLLHIMYSYTVENCPGPALLGMQDRNTVRETVTDRVVPMLKNTPSLRRFIARNPDDITGQMIRTRTSVLYLAWAGSEGRLASKPICHGFFDEVDLWDETAITSARARFRTYESMLMSKIVEACTVSTTKGRIWSAQHEAHAKWDFYAICPYCGHPQPLSFSGIRWADGVVDPAELSTRGDAWYECEKCQAHWDEEDRNEAVLSGSKQHDPPQIWHGWRPRPGTPERHINRPEKIWIHIPPLLSRFVMFHVVAAAYLRQLQQPTAANIKYFYCDCCAMPVPEVADGIEIKETELLKRRENYAPELAGWQIPMSACILIGDSDVQANRIEAEVVAWGPGHESWGVIYKIFRGDTSRDQVWDDLHNWVQTVRFTHETGVKMRIEKFGIDLGYAARKVAKFVKRSPRIYVAHKGSNNASDPFIPRRPSRSKYGVPFYLLGVSEGKDDLFSWIQAGQDHGGQMIHVGPRACHWNMNYDFDYFRMLCAEAPKWEKNKKTGELEKAWSLRDGYVRNEALDIRVGNMAVREIVNPNYERLAERLKNQAEAAAATELEEVEARRDRILSRATENYDHEPDEETADAPGRNRPGWYNRR